MDPAAQGRPPCLKAVATVSVHVKATETIFTDCPLTVYLHHSVETLLNYHHTQRLSTCYLANFEILLSSSHLTITQGNLLNPPTLLPLSDDNIFHDHITLTNFSPHDWTSKKTLS